MGVSCIEMILYDEVCTVRWKRGCSEGFEGALKETAKVPQKDEDFGWDCVHCIMEEVLRVLLSNHTFVMLSYLSKKEKQGVGLSLFLRDLVTAECESITFPLIRTDKLESTLC